VDPATACNRFAAARVARLSTVTAACGPHVVPCTFVLRPDGDHDVVGIAIDDVKPKTTLAVRRLDHLRANPAASVLVDHYAEDWATLWWVRADGTARILESGAEYEHTLDLLAMKHPQYVDRRPPGAVIAIDITSWRSWP
jgi:PPOX class probable F420-dependent enzyme